MSDVTKVKELATRLRRDSRQGSVLELCDAVLALKEVMPAESKFPEARSQAAHVTPPGACPVCEARRKAHAALMRQRRRQKESRERK